MAMADDLPVDGDVQDETIPTKKDRLDLLGIPQSSGSIMFKKQEKRRQEIMTGEGDFSIRKKKSRFLAKSQ